MCFRRSSPFMPGILMSVIDGDGPFREKLQGFLPEATVMTLYPASRKDP